MEAFQRTRLLTVVVLAVVFGSGALLGKTWDSLRSGPEEVVVTDQVSGDEQAERQEGEERPRRRNMYEQVGQLSAAQRAQIDSVVGAHGFELRGAYREFRRQDDELREDYNEAARAIFLRTREGIKQVMTPAQAMVYDSLLTDFDRRREERRRNEESDSRR